MDNLLLSPSEARIPSFCVGPETPLAVDLELRRPQRSQPSLTLAKSERRSTRRAAALTRISRATLIQLLDNELVILESCPTPARRGEAKLKMQDLVHELFRRYDLGTSS